MEATEIDREALEKLLEAGGGKFVSGPELLTLLGIAANDRSIWVKIGLRVSCPEGHVCPICDKRKKGAGK